MQSVPVHPLPPPAPPLPVSHQTVRLSKAVDRHPEPVLYIRVLLAAGRSVASVRCTSTFALEDSLMHLVLQVVCMSWGLGSGGGSRPSRCGKGLGSRPTQQCSGSVRPWLVDR